MTRLLIGLAPATGLDGVGALLVEQLGQGLEAATATVAAHSEPIPTELRDLLRRLVAGEACDVRTLAISHRALGEVFARAARALVDQAQVRLSEIFAVGLEPLVLCHDGEGQLPARLELGSAACLAERTGLTVASDFAWRDLAAGGNGGPLVALPDFLLFRSENEFRAVLHLDELAAVSLLPPGDDERRIRCAWAGPGMGFLETLLRQVSGGRDRGIGTGHLAVQGRCIPELLERWLHHPFLLKKWPKSASRASFGRELARQAVLLAQQKHWDARDVLCTAHHWVAECAARTLRHLQTRLGSAERIVLTGSGARNGFLWRLIKAELPGPELQSSDDLGWPAEFHGAATAAVLTGLLLDREPANLPHATGAAGHRLLGSITPGTLTHWSACLAAVTGQPNFYADELEVE